MTRVLVLSGACGSGKSTIAQLLSDHHGWIRVSEDEVWQRVFQNDRDRIGSDEHLRKREVVRRQVLASISREPITKRVVVDATVHDTDPTSVREYEELFRAADVEWQIRVLHPRLEVAIARDADREVRTLGARRVEGLWRKFSGELLDARAFLDTSDDDPDETVLRVLESLREDLPPMKGAPRQGAIPWEKGGEMEGPPVLPPKTPDILGEVRGAIVETAGSELVGLYLHGSLVSGGFDPAVSDIDLIAVLEDDPGEELASRLGSMHDSLARTHPEWDDRIEVVYVSAQSLQRWDEGIPRMAVISAGEPFHVVSADTAWVLTWYPSREDAVTLLGPSLRELIPEIAKDDFLAAVRTRLRRFVTGFGDEASPGACAYAILTTCRGLHTLKLGRRPSKLEAATWAARAFPEWESLISEALQWRQKQWEVRAPDPVAIRATRVFLRAMSEHIGA